MTTDERVDELLSSVKILDTKVLFLQQDIDEVKDMLREVTQLLITINMNMRSKPEDEAHDAVKAARLAEFQQATSRW